MSTSSASSQLPSAPPPWSCKCTMYVLPFFTSASVQPPSNKILAPLEAQSEAWTSEKVTGKHKGGIGFAQIVRYSDTPVGAYDELVILPGHYEAPQGIECTGKYMRITGIWVSQEATCMNGRKNWNIPKHMAQFKFESTGKSTLPLRVEVSEPGSDAPFFAATIQRTTYTPTFSFTSLWQGYFGWPTQCLQPPLPAGTPAHLEVGTSVWTRIAPILKSKKCRLVWLDMQQPARKVDATENGHEENSAPKDAEVDNWYPGIGRWRLGMSCEDAVLELGNPDTFAAVSN